MAERSAPDSGWPELQRALEAIDGVVGAFRHAETGKVWLICDAGASRDAVGAAAADALSAAGAAEEAVEVALRDTQPPPARVRFQGVHRIAHHNGRVTIRVTLSLRGREATGEVTTEEALPLELRGAAGAALDALESLLERDLDLRLVGVKPLRAFDADVIAVSLHRPGPEPRFLVGAVLATDEPLRGAAIAVLDALNRTLAIDGGS